MTTQLGSKNIPLRAELTKVLWKMWKQQLENPHIHTHKEFGGFVNDLLEDYLFGNKWR